MTSPQPVDKVNLRSLLWVGPLTVVASVVAVLIMRAMAVAILNPSPAFTPLGLGPPMAFTTLLVTAAVIVFANMGRFVPRPIRTFQIVSVVVLVLSFIPDILLLTAPAGPPPGAVTSPAGGPPMMGGVTVPNVLALMVMHIVAYWVCVTLLTRLARAK
ncbi:MAG TPA: DUF6069 family protein [Anaerolineales bacterium]|nr:DUF6069 family protein [Anaerolineales bacterium]